MKRVLNEYRVGGIKTTIPFHKKVMDNPGFQQGNYDTTFIDKHLTKVAWSKSEQRIAAIGMVLGQRLNTKPAAGIDGKKKIDQWKLQGRRQNMRDW
jgi:pyruvate carboxylase